jgi:hypothetical protein
VITVTRIHQTRFYLVAWADGDRAAAVVDDFGNLVFVSLRVHE